MKNFEKNYIEYSDSGVLVKYIGDNRIDIDDYIHNLLNERDREWKDKIEKLKPLKKCYATMKDEMLYYVDGYNQAIEDIKNKLN